MKHLAAVLILVLIPAATLVKEHGGTCRLFLSRTGNVARCPRRKTNAVKVTTAPA
jgi:hypothetical protein